MRTIDHDHHTATDTVTTTDPDTHDPVVHDPDAHDPTSHGLAGGHRHGLVTPATSGLTSSGWRRALRSGALVALHHRVACVPDAPRTMHQRIAAAVLAAGDGALASHRSAAMLWHLVPVPTVSTEIDRVVVDVMVPRSRHPRVGDWSIVVHRPTDMGDLDPATLHGIACTSITRTLCDLGAADPAAVDGAVQVAIDLDLTSIEELERSAQRHSRPGRGGIPALRDALVAARRRTDGSDTRELVEVGGRAPEGAGWRRR